MAEKQDITIPGDIQKLSVDGRFNDQWTLQLQLLQQIAATLNEIKANQDVLLGVTEQIRDQA